MRFAINAHLVAANSTYRQAGVSRYTELLINNLAELDREDEFIIYTAPGQQPPGFAEAPNFRLAISHLPTVRPPVRIGWEQFLAPSILLKDRPALLHCPVNVVPLAAPCPTVLTIHDLGFLRFPERYKTAKRLYLTTATKLSAKRAAHIITDAEAIRQEVIELLKVPPHKVTAIPLAADQRFKPITDTAQLEAFRREKELPARFVLYVGTLEPRKNLPLLLQGFARLRHEQPHTVKGVELVLGGGKGWMYEEIFRLVRELGLAEITRFPGYISDADLPLWYNIADVMVYPSLYEGFGFPPLEAMSCGTPVITSNTSSLPEVVGDAGITITPTDDRELAHALARILTEPGLSEDLRRRGLAQAARFNYRETARRTLEVYRQVASK
ncbi:MAG: glycosyltransferase family 4 protein [Chloroflexi bacterium]|uniref:Glycosyltransferase family 4 protein n=1 Tax=Candidatus Chlorohelix allophototropha TaxID=3003348 RepID=A0A8T7M032_9CHLR|nr:glycosyltransferase family 4 protein [Chloroflexota bacterium]WJW67843.1 glycosyltransferase family 4 protein [Chloroflexota bacterium L227-S17]